MMTYQIIQQRKVEKKMNSKNISFIEQQFPVSKISKECYKERKAGQSQTLTGLGKWWGRKPLILIRSAILGLLMPASENPAKDREIFLKILSMDEEGLWLRKNKPIKRQEIINHLTKSELVKYFNGNEFKKEVTNEDKKYLQKLAFARMSYDDKLTYCLRPEELNKLTEYTWKDINEHLSTDVSDLPSLIQELGIRKFGEIPSVGDCFSGGGSIPFEAARIGLKIFASDLNPLAGLLTWASLNIISLSDIEIQKLKDFQEKVFDILAKQIDVLGIEKNEKGMMAKYYLYCNETICPECNTKIPLLPHRIISTRSSTIVNLIFNEHNNNYDFEILSNVSKDDLKYADNDGTVIDYELNCPRCKLKTPIPALRKDKTDEENLNQYRYSTPNDLRKWKKDDFVPDVNDIYTERLYCIKYLKKKENKTWDEYLRKPSPATDSSYGKIYYLAPSEQDLKREDKVIQLLKTKFDEWMEKGFIPTQKIREGDNTNQPIYEKGWTHWHHLFNARQLIYLGLLNEISNNLAQTNNERIFSILGINKCADQLCKLSKWNPGTHKGEPLFINQSLNTYFNFPVRALAAIYTSWIFPLSNYPFKYRGEIKIGDASTISENNEIWITDPPYADAINYHELSEFFLSWDKKVIQEVFPSWYSDSKRALAVKGIGESFNKSMVEVYRNLTTQMPDNGIQIVMFTHQDPSVWADLTLILWSSGLKVTAAWNVSTETESGGLKEGNYVKGTVILVLRKQTSDVKAYLDELYPEIQEEVKNQIASMRQLDDREDPNFYDPDYVLAAYAASLKVLTAYNSIEDIDVEYELSKSTTANKTSPIEQIITSAIRIAYDQLIPPGFDGFTWKSLEPVDRFYIKGLELEKSGLKQLAAYQEMARGFGIKNYKNLLASTKANAVRLKTATELGSKMLRNNEDFSNTLIRHLLMAFYQAIKAEDALQARTYLKSDCPYYDNNRTTLIYLCEYFEKIEHHSDLFHRYEETKYAKYLIQLLRDDGV